MQAKVPSLQLSIRCAVQNFVRTNSWESYISSGGTSIILYDSHGCGGMYFAFTQRSNQWNKAFGLLQRLLSTDVCALLFVSQTLFSTCTLNAIFI